jgi:SAM-dependent methyltransferase
MKDYHVRSDCRLCRGPISEVLRLPNTPLANELSPSADFVQDVFPLFLSRCDSCGHVQLPVVVSPDRLFRHYVYQSGTSHLFVKHLHDFARDVAIPSGGFVVEIGSNDGTLLAEYARLGATVVGVDPADNIADIAVGKNDVPTIRAFFGKDVLGHHLFGGRKADLIVANNVFAHADDLSGILEGVRCLLSDDGRFVFEVGYLCDVVSRGLYRVVYHEHVSYHHLSPLRDFFARHGLHLYDAVRVSTQGGSVRCFARITGPDDAISPGLAELLAAETPESVDSSTLSTVITTSRDSLRSKLDAAREAGKTVCGYGSPAQLVTTCYALGLTREDVSFVADDNPLKHGMFTPGLCWPIVPPALLRETKPDVCVIFSANFSSDIISRYSDLGCEWIIP